MINGSKDSFFTTDYTDFHRLFIGIATVLSFKTIPIILVILRKTIIFAHSDA